MKVGFERLSHPQESARFGPEQLSHLPADWVECGELPAQGVPVDQAQPAAVTGSFAERVRHVVSCIPRGRVTSYGRIARALGSPRSARMVGWALANLPADHDYPAHRVVNRTGYLSGAEAWGDPRIMRDLLVAEGIPFRDEWEVDLYQCLWDPADDPTMDPYFMTPDTGTR